MCYSCGAAADSTGAEFFCCARTANYICSTATQDRYTKFRNFSNCGSSDRARARGNKNRRSATSSGDSCNHFDYART